MALKIFSVAAALLSLLAAAAAPAPSCSPYTPPRGDYLTNGGFECGSANWTATKIDATTSVTFGPPGSKNSQKSFKVARTSKTAAGAAPLANLTQPVNLDELGYYTMSFNVQFGGLSQKLDARVGEANMTTVQAGDRNLLGVWRHVDVVFVGGPEGVQDVKFRFYGVNGSSPGILLDNVSLTFEGDH